MSDGVPRIAIETAERVTRDIGARVHHRAHAHRVALHAANQPR